MHFSVYKRPFINRDGTYTFYMFIVLVDDMGLKHFTNFGKYVRSSSSAIQKKYNGGNNEFSYVRMLLEYAFFHEDMEKLSDLTVDIVQRFFELYHQCDLPFDKPGQKRSTSTMSRCRSVIMDFCTNLSNAGVVSFKPDDLYTVELKRDRRRGIVTKHKVPRFTIQATPTKSEYEQYRDIPTEAFDVIFSYIREYHPEILGLIACSAFVGLRPSEACNVRRMDCPLYGPGIRMTMNTLDKPTYIEIDLERELKLRSDNVYVGRIKKERTQPVPDQFRQPFYDSINEYLEYTRNKKREEEYGALNINAQGKCFTYKSYRNHFQKILNEEIVPVLLRSEDRELVSYGRILMEKNLAPHAFRHFYTVQLVLAGVTNVAELMTARGDSWPESALVYINNKSDIEKRYTRVNEKHFGYLVWGARKLHGS